MAEDISNKTIVVLVVLTVLISILGTVVVLNEVSSTQIVLNQEPPTVSTSRTSGKAEVRLTILSNEQKPQSDSAIGYVTLEII
ncbi:hypothetical protein KY348_05195 [Candidatus Woesearchaeota archaeon]|nr:hypothetical protein [Candidatus Woesearchaeota archaeon]